MTFMIAVFLTLLDVTEWTSSPQKVMISLFSYHQILSSYLKWAAFCKSELLGLVKLCLISVS